MVDVGPINTWARLNAVPELGDLAGVFSTALDWTEQGNDPAKLGLAAVADMHQKALAGETVDVPQLADVSISLLERGEIQIVRLPPEGTAAEPEILAAGIFTDSHPQEWVSRLAADGRAILAVGPKGPWPGCTPRQWRDTWSVAIVSLAQTMTAAGMGIVAPVCAVCDGPDPDWIQDFTDGSTWMLCPACAREIKRGRNQRIIARARDSLKASVIDELALAAGPPRQAVLTNA